MILPNNPAYHRCKACGGSRIALGTAENAYGKTVHPYFCRDCGEVMTQYASKQTAAQVAREDGPLPNVTLKSTKLNKPTEKDKPCEVCGSTGTTERHHWAPRHLFGEEAYRWPTSYLCQRCHVRWHQTVTPNMGKLTPGRGSA